MSTSKNAILCHQVKQVNVTKSSSEESNRAVGDRDRLIAAALRVMAREESVDPTVAEILVEAGLFRNAFYRQFKSKDDLLIAVLENGLTTLLAYIDRKLAAVETPAERVRAWVGALLDQARHPDVAPATRAVALNGPRLASRIEGRSLRSDRALQEPLQHAIADGAASGVFPHARPGPDAVAIHELVRTRMMTCLIERRVPAADEVEHLREVVLGILTRRPPTVLNTPSQSRRES